MHKGCQNPSNISMDQVRKSLELHQPRSRLLKEGTRCSRISGVLSRRERKGRKTAIGEGKVQGPFNDKNAWVKKRPEARHAKRDHSNSLVWFCRGMDK